MYDDTYYQPVTQATDNRSCIDQLMQCLWPVLRPSLCSCQGWMFVPLDDYHAGGAAAAFAPLHQHLAEYEWALAQYFGYGVMPCWRGSQLYDSPEVQAVVAKWVSFYKRHRAILTSDIVHVRRADGRGVDAILHINPQLPTRGLAVVYNPTSQWQNHSLPVNLYYTGLTSTAQLAEQDGEPVTVQLERDFTVAMLLQMAPRSVTWFTIS